MSNIFDSLNEEQIEAVKSTDGYVMAVAGAGSGKTMALTNRYAYLVENGVSQDNILCVTFTNEAAKNMKNKIEKLTGLSNSKYVCTFHSLCAKFLKEEIYNVSYPKNFQILDDSKQDKILNDIVKELKSSRFSLFQLKKFISRCKGKSDYVKDAVMPKYQLKNLEYRDYLKDNGYIANSEDLKYLSKVFFRYLYEEQLNYYLDFDDLIAFTVYILNNNMGILEKWQNQFHYIQIDEYQDINDIQNTLCELLSGKFKNLFIVGDPDQTIYTWRDANPKMMEQFEEKHQNTKIIIFDKNYRSSRNILNAANSLIQYNENKYKKILKTDRNDNITIKYAEVKDTYVEAEWVTKNIEELVKNGSKLRDIAILYRINRQSEQIAEMLKKHNIEYIIYDGNDIYKTDEVRFIISFIDLLVFGDDFSFEEVVNNIPNHILSNEELISLRNSAKVKDLRLLEFIGEQINCGKILNEELINFYKIFNNIKCHIDILTPIELVQRILQDTGYEDYIRSLSNEEKLDNILTFKSLAYTYSEYESKDIVEYINNLSLNSKEAKEVENKDAVKLYTIHKAKGLEFNNVFVIGLSEKVLPLERNSSIGKELEEERRLCFVAMTRAKNQLYLSYPQESYNQYYNPPSRFITEIGKDNLEYFYTNNEN